MKRRDTLAWAAGTAAAAAVAVPPWMHSAAAQAGSNSANSQAAGAAAGQRVLRYAISAAETSFDPAQINDNTSRTITSHIFESLYCYDHLARPPRIVPLVADGDPVIEDNFRRWTFKVRPGIYFADDPAFKGPDGRQIRRELAPPLRRLDLAGLERVGKVERIVGKRLVGLELRQRIHAPTRILALVGHPCAQILMAFAAASREHDARTQ